MARLEVGPWTELKPRTRTERLLYGSIVAIPIAWLLGFGEFVWLPVAALALYELIRRRRGVLAPRGFLLWIGFVILGFLSSSHLVLEGEIFAVHTHFLTLYVAGSILFLYVFNAREDELSDKRLLGAVALLWVIVVVGGLLTTPLNQITYSSPATELMTALDAEARMVSYTRVEFADARNNLGDDADPTGTDGLRPKTFFSETNHWGSAFAALAPAAAVVALMLRSGVERRAAVVVAVASVVPLVLSQSRWVWAVLAATAIYGAARLWRPRLAHVGWAVAGALVVVLVASVTPLGDVVTSRLTNDGSEWFRQQLFESAFENIDDAPILGFGQAIATDHTYLDEPVLDGRPLGFDSQLLNTMIFHGIPALLLFAGWLLAIAVASGRIATPVELVAHLTVLTLGLHSVFYVIMPHRMMVLMILTAAMYRRRVFDGTYPLSNLVGKHRRRLSTAN